MEKPRITLAQFRAMQQEKSQYAVGTIAWLLGRILEERAQPGARPIGTSQGYIMRALQRSPLGMIALAEIKPVDYLNHCRARIAAGAKPQTVNQDATYLGSSLKYAVEILEVDGAEVAYAALRKAKPQLVREQLIGKSVPRNRRPTPEELDRLLALFGTPPKHPRKGLIPMVPIVKFSYLTSRRISETCRITWSDLDHEKRTCLVRDLKNAKGKGFHDSFPLLGEAWDLVMAQPRVGERIFPFNPKSCGAKYTRAKAKLGIVNLRLHDNRRDCLSRLFEEGYSVPEVQKVSLHRNAAILLRTYTALKPEDLHLGPAARRQAEKDRKVQLADAEKFEKAAAESWASV